MFNTDIIHFLQQFDHPVLYWFMVIISSLGTAPFILTVIFGITFGVDFKKGLVLVNMVAWTILLTVIAKDQVDYPRPPDVDSSLITEYETGTDFSSEQPKSFFETFSTTILDYTRVDKWKRQGFPSGHTSLQVSLWVGLFFLFRKRWIGILGIILVILTMISRLYLAHHFLGDVLGGLALGIVACALLILLIIRTKYLSRLSHQVVSLSILWIPLLLVPFANYIPVFIPASLIGINGAALLIILQKNFPVFHVILWKRILAALFPIMLLLFLYYLNKSTTYSSNDFLQLLIISLIYFVAIRVAIIINTRLYLIRFRF